MNLNSRTLLSLALSSTLLLACRGKGGAQSDAREDAAAQAHGDADQGGEGKAHGAGGAHEEVIQLTPEAVRSAQLKTETVQRKALAVGLAVPGRVAFTQMGVARVAARVPGRLASIEASLGQKVKKGQALGYLESPELGRARADYLSAATKTRVAEDNFRREKELFAKGISSEREMREAESAFVTAQAERNAADGRLHAVGLSDAEIAALRGNEHYSSRFPAPSPLDGTVVEIAGIVGQTVEAATTLFTVADLSELWVLLDISESQLAQVREGQPVDFTVSALPERRFTGRVEYIGDIVDEKTRTIPVRVVVPNADRALKPGMFAQAEISTRAEVNADGGGAQAPRVVLPREAVQKVGEEQVVFVPSGENQFKPIKVRTGASSAKEVEVLSGLESGALVVTQGAFILKSELSKESMGEGHSD
ncbi:cobalt/zinc/cadmium efflux RND transporter membrane fusion protein, CzcB family [Cystobacter fuscus]|uniref:Cobalt/zinc/cadmium efflux RND transporter membrane fusion protein, CzcB family n=1 Tax=Cystobacter fuscus TaxID=43 RepID=A0A250IWD5_9BACT|nr:efflux RND transporter periplasmic adaptor subunit [Cystobacter fuscus]ATB35206.1 cobalt/zinc/cadmium efflux RND transporter membrane fusion protein, CzcB family [Cystobacter fuscus]